MNKIVKNTLYLYSRQLFTLFLSLYTSRLTLQVLGVTDFGIFAAVGGVTAFLAILTSSLSNSTQRFLTFALGKKDHELLNRAYISGVEIHISLSLLLLLLAETIGLYFFYTKMVLPTDRLDISFWVFQFSILTVIVNIITAPHYAEIVAHEDMGVFALFSVFDAILKLSSVTLLFYISYDRLFVYSVFVFVIQAILRTSILAYCKWKYAECYLKMFFDRQLCQSMLSLTSWNFVSNLGVMGFVQGTNIMLNTFFGTAINAAYSISFQAYFGIRNFTSSFQLASNPQIVKLYSEDNLEEMKKLLMSVCKFSFYLVFILSFPIIMNSDLILSVWLKDVPTHTQHFFILLLAFSYFEVIGYPLDIAAQATGNVKNYSIAVCCLYLSILLFSYVAYQLGAIPETIIYVAIILAFISIVVRAIFLQNLIKMRLYIFFKKSLLKPLEVILVVCPIIVFLKIMLGSLAITASLLFFFAIFLFEVAVIYMIGLEGEERKLTKDYFRKFYSVFKNKKV